MIDPIREEVVVALSVARAFERFTRGLHQWWPRQYTWSQDALQAIGLEPRLGGFCFEIGPHGFRCDWGRVLEWAPPEHLRLAWQISPLREPVPNPAQASSVSIGFAVATPQQTRVVLVHDGFDRHGAHASAYRDAMASPDGWAFILHRFAEAAI